MYDLYKHIHAFVSKSFRKHKAILPYLGFTVYTTYSHLPSNFNLPATLQGSWGRCDCPPFMGEKKPRKNSDLPKITRVYKRLPIASLILWFCNYFHKRTGPPDPLRNGLSSQNGSSSLSTAPADSQLARRPAKPRQSRPTEGKVRLSSHTPHRSKSCVSQASFQF